MILTVTPDRGSNQGRRRFLQLGAAAAALSLRGATVESRTFAYKKVGDLHIHADVWRAPGDAAQPVAVWIHGGALITGRRQSVPPRLLATLHTAGFTVVSLDYRLAPETKLPAILEDIEDAFRWIRQDGPRLFHADSSRIAVLGSSAGGYLTLTAGYRVRPRPNALVAFWGYGDLIGPWYSAPSPHERHRRIVLSREEALARVNGPPIANADDRPGDGGAFYQHCRQHGIWPREVSGWDPAREPGRFNPYMPLVNVTAGYPPTLLVHGTADTDVPHEQSVLMAEQFRKHGVQHRLITVDGAEHGLAGAPPAALEDAYAAAVAFIQQRNR
jgi:acetyl esterase/lipase